jgi:multiple sugar transport system ATP-binding protein
MSRVLLRDLSKHYENGVRALHEVNLEIAAGEFMVLVGPSGCGKSTILRTIAGLETPSSGIIEIGGVVINEAAPKDRNLAMVFQNYALYPHMTVFENMAFGLKMRGVRRDTIEEQVSATARMLGMEDLLGRKPLALSGGQRQRVALGRAIVRNPQCFLFDEPLSNLDAKLRGAMRTEIKRLHQRLKATSIYVTHDQEEAMTLGDRIAVMKDGVLQQCGAPLDVYHRPVNRFVAGFLGTPQMNFLEGKIVPRDGDLFFDEGSQQIGGLGIQGGIGPAGLGIRPQAVRLGPSGPGLPALSARVDLVEMLGDRMDVFLSTGEDSRMVARVEARSDVRPGDVVPVAIDPSQIHLFAADDAGRSLRGGG